MKPGWVTDTPARSFRSIFRWGAGNKFKHPNDHLVELMEQIFGMTEKDFASPKNTGLDPFSLNIPPRLDEKHLTALRNIVGSESVQTETIERIKASYGKTMIDLLRMREHIVENLPDAVIYPRDNSDVAGVMRYCIENKIPLYAKGAGSSVTRGFEAVSGGVTLDMTRHMNRIIKVNPVNETVTVEAGMYGPALESQLQDAKKIFGAPHNYTCGHFPQSFEYSTVGGWVVTRGAGQNSTYYGKMEDIVISQHYITPAGELITRETPASATGPDIDAILMGSEGTFGILCSATLRIRRFHPGTRKRFSYIFRDFDSGLAAAREIMQSENGLPSVFRLSDPEETDVALRLYGVYETPLDWILRVLRYKPGKRCLLIGSSDGNREYTEMVRGNIRRIASRFGAISTTGFVTKQWEKGRFSDPYMRDDLMDFGVIIDTLECATSWDNVNHVYETVRKICHNREKTVVMTHLSHFYPQGANLYFIFIARMEREEFVGYHKSIINGIGASGAAISHHHGIGRLLAPWFADHIGPASFGLLKAIKNYFDPAGILNPGALGLNEDKNREK